MGLEQRPDARQFVRVADHDRVGIADVDDDYVQPCDLLGLSDGDRAEILLHVTVLDSRDGRTRPDVDAHFLGARSIGEPPGRDTGAVARKLCRRAVGVPDHDVGAIGRRGDNLDDAVGVAHRRSHALRGQADVVSEQVDVPVRVPLRESHPRPRPRASPPRP
jgi:hypothetical protein